MDATEPYHETMRNLGSVFSSIRVRSINLKKQESKRQSSVMRVQDDTFSNMAFKFPAPIVIGN
ncbi:hypothetical protein BCR33DRAFT_720453 [Rhizoclosmatium globosum]|uniref:Uncharacterized protein n=1 Tax=Rhizoclosmatium globosum TaxID=329046 RepID=A0A1Y2BVH2_9FUNG|nr:hypothetical protein BCR33DRAFT_720453 [Rhizoclosmatium globosum]|eukprot:ORY38772.1 hypothetical protein BCR33DRAFT_720453 [Rhizoclosmatium globosum]